jgi:hypothetical protein
MRPLSVFNYYARNKLKLAPIFLVLALAVFGISLTGVLTGSIMDTARERIQVYRGMAMLSPSFRNGHNTIDAAIKGDLYRNSNVAAVYPDIRVSTYLPTLSGTTSAHIYAVDTNVFSILMERFDLELDAGQLPRTGANEVALHTQVIKARGLQLGDTLDPEKDSQERLPAKMHIVGVLRGPTVLSLASLEYVSQRTEFRGYARSLLALPQPGERVSLESDLNALDAGIVRAFTLSAETKLFQRDFGTLDAIVWAINSVVVIVLSLLVGLLNMIYFLDRMNEFGLLLGMGYARAFVVRRALTESLALTVGAWVFGIIFSAFAYAMLNVFIFEPMGTTLSVLNWRAIQFTLPIPIIVGIFAAATVIWQLRNFDPISIIERRD